MASIPGAVFKAGKIHDEISRFRKRSASDAMDRKPFADAAQQLEAGFRGRSVSVTTPPRIDGESSPTSGLSPAISGLSPAISGESLRNLVGGFMGSLSVLKPKSIIDSSLESVNEDIPAMRNCPNAGSISDLAQLK